MRRPIVVGGRYWLDAASCRRGVSTRKTWREWLGAGRWVRATRVLRGEMVLVHEVEAAPGSCLRWGVDPAALLDGPPS